jgi:hypothetical protein
VDKKICGGNQVKDLKYDQWLEDALTDAEKFDQDEAREEMEDGPNPDDERDWENDREYDRNYE